MFKRLDNYLLKRYFFYYFSAVLVFITIFFVVDIVEHIDNFIDNGMGFIQIVFYYLYTFPFFIHISLPMSALLAVVFQFGMLNKRSELVAMKSSGISLYRIATPFLVVGIFVSFVAFTFEDKVVVPANQELTILKQEYMNNRKRPSPVVKRDIYLQLRGGNVLALNRFDTRSNVGHGISLQMMENGVLNIRMDGESLHYLGDGSWRMKHIEQRDFRSGHEIYSLLDSVDFQWDILPEDISQDNISPSNMDFRQLGHFIAKLQANGLGTTRWEVKRHFKTAMNFTSFIVILFGIPLVSKQKRGGGMASGVGMSLMIIFIYTGVLKFGETLGYSGVLKPFASVWIPNLIFFITGSIMLLRAQK